MLPKAFDSKMRMLKKNGIKKEKNKLNFYGHQPGINPLKIAAKYLVKAQNKIRQQWKLPQITFLG